MGSTGIDRATGKVKRDWDHVLQSVSTIWTTFVGSRIMRRSFGGAGLGLIGRRLIPQTIALARLLTVLSLERWEPRVRVRRIVVAATVDEARAGEITMQIEVDYMPNGHKGDTTVAATRDIELRG